MITFSEYPAVHEGQELEGIRLEFDGGKVVEASATRGEELLQGSSTATRAHGGSASSASAATPASRAT